jgi:hypothetical protein
MPSAFMAAPDRAMPQSNPVTHAAAKSLGQRVLAVDLLRGLCLVLMTIDHCPQNPFLRFSNTYFGPFGFFTSASGFVFLSGWVVGRVYGKHRERYGDTSLNRRIWGRMGKLYLAQWILILVTGVIGPPIALHFGVAPVLAFDQIHTWKALLMAGTLLYQPDYMGVLPMYLLFLLLTPLLLRQLQTGHVWRVLTCSAIVWFLSGLFIRLNIAFNPLSYQILFVLGIVLGERRWQLDSLRPKLRAWVVPACLLLTVLFYLLRLRLADSLSSSFAEALNGPLLQALFSFRAMGPLRILNFAVFGVTVSWVCTKFKSVDLNHPAFQWLILLGQNSLPVFTFSVIVSALAPPFLPANSRLALDLGMMFLAVASLTVPAFLASQVAGKLPHREISASRTNPQYFKLTGVILTESEAILRERQP